MGNKSAAKRDPKFVLTIVAVFFMAAIIIVLVLLLMQMRENNRLAQYQGSMSEEDRSKIQYEENSVTIVDDAEALQRAVEEMWNAPRVSISLNYQNDAYSTDGEHFDCMIGNSEDNGQDAFFTIYADAEKTDEIYVSGLIRPGNALDKIKLSHPLEPGDHTVHVTIALVEEQDGQQTVAGRMSYTMVFHVAS